MIEAVDKPQPAGALEATVVEDPVVELRLVEGFDTFYRREMPALVGFARSLSGSASAEDIAQEAMLAAYRRWDTVSRMDVPAAWVRRVCANRSVSTLRRRAVELRGLTRLAERGHGEPLADEHEECWSEVRTLPRRQAQVIALHYVYDLGVAEIAHTLGCAEGTVKSHLFRGRAALAARLGRTASVRPFGCASGRGHRCPGMHDTSAKPSGHGTRARWRGPEPLADTWSWPRMIRWMKSLTRLRSTDDERSDALTRDWERLRAQATTPSEVAEIDAIFSRHAA